VRSKLFEAKPDLVINAAAYNNVDAAESEGRDLCYLLNRDAPGYIAEAVKELSKMNGKDTRKGVNQNDALTGVCPTFVQYSTDYVFGGANPNGYGEDDPTDPISEYGRSKAEGEKRIQEIYDQVYIIRPSRIFGQMGSGEGVKESFVDLMLRLSQDRDQFDMVDEELTSPTYAPDLAKRTREIVENYPPGIYHGTNEGACTWYGFAEEIFKQIGRTDIKLNKVGSDHYPRPAKRPACSWLLNTKLPPARSWQEALAEYLKENKKIRN
ncbi:MAG: sugar nucleotide-binding protein, partial [Candidatus Uhrbacteria bacterium]